MTEEKTTTLATDEATGSVRPADRRYNQQKFTAKELHDIREQEIQEGYENLLEQKKAEEEANQAALEASGYVNPTAPVEESAQSKAFGKVHGTDGAPAVDESGPATDGAPADKQPAAKTAAAKK
jgi:hypothetical protein